MKNEMLRRTKGQEGLEEPPSPKAAGEAEGTLASWLYQERRWFNGHDWKGTLMEPSLQGGLDCR